MYRCRFIDNLHCLFPHSHQQKENLSSAKNGSLLLCLHPRRKLAQLAHLRANLLPPNTSQARPLPKVTLNVVSESWHSDYFFTCKTCQNFIQKKKLSFQLPQHRNLLTGSERARPNLNLNPNNRKLNPRVHSRSQSTGSWRGWCLS